MRYFFDDLIVPLIGTAVIAVLILGPLIGLLFYARYASGTAKAEYLNRHHAHEVTWQEAAEIRITFDANSGKAEVSE